MTIQATKLSAAESKQISLSASQIGMEDSLFVMMKKFETGVWSYPKYSLNSNSYRAFLNPRLISITDIHEFGIEECLSRMGERAQVKRPIAVTLGFQDEKGNVKEESFFDFEARVICHELDHLEGIDMFENDKSLFLKGSGSGLVFEEKLAKMQKKIQSESREEQFRHTLMKGAHQKPSSPMDVMRDFMDEKKRD